MQNNQLSPPRVVITMGEAAGIGPELIVRIAQLEFNAQLIVLADGVLLSNIASQLGVKLVLSKVDWSDKPQKHISGHLWIEEHRCENPVFPGQLDQKNAKVTLAILNRASELALSKQVDAIVTAPVHKANLNKIAPQFLGHTEYFAELAKVPQVVMMLATKELRMTLATTHLPLKKVSTAITKKKLRKTIEIILSSLNKQTQQSLRMAVCGLNPHAGEDGLLGEEEITTISPVIEEMKKEGFDLTGPLPADTLFTPQKREQFDVFLAMYHDQGLPVIKASGFGECANVTLGLPYIRTSVDHGTALDIAPQYKASGESLEFAINYAIELVAGRLP